MSEPVFRFAPSPNGYLHLGHAFWGALNDTLARAAGGRLPAAHRGHRPGARCRPEFEAAIYADLELARPRLGSVRCGGIPNTIEVYRSELARLRAQGLDLSRHSRARTEICAAGSRRSNFASGGIWPRDPDGAPVYPGAASDLSETERARRIAAGEPHAWRLDIEGGAVTPWA